MFSFSKFIIHVTIPLLAGGCIYIFFRSPDIKMFEWFNTIGIIEIILNLREVAQSNINLNSWILYSLPDGLLTYSFTSSMIILWRNNDRLGKTFIYLPLMLSVLSELLQYFEIISGTFDRNDLSVVLISFLICNLFLNLKIYET